MAKSSVSSPDAVEEGSNETCTAQDCPEGSGAPRGQFVDVTNTAGVFDVIRRAPQPVLGICGGHQQIALCYGARVSVMKRLEANTTGYDGCLRERGFFEVETEEGGIFAGLPRHINVWHSHFDEVKELPRGFRRTASNPTCSLQAMQHTERPLFSVQFHPELFDEEHPHGSQVLENFLNL